MTAEQYSFWLGPAIEDYANENVATGRWRRDEALQKSREEYARLLPDGVSTPGNRLWSIVRSSDGRDVGQLWINLVDKPTPRAFVYNIEIYPEFRRQGFAKQAMLRLEVEVRGLGLDRIGLHVFGHNSAARTLYDNLGYTATNINMVKHLA